MQNLIKYAAANWIIACIVVLATQGYSVAQETSAKTDSQPPLAELPPEEVGEQANALLKQLISMSETGTRYVQAMQDANPEDRLVLELQLWSLQDRSLDTLYELSDALMALEKTAPQPELRKEVEDLFRYVLERSTFHIDRLRGKVDAARAARMEAAADERYSIEEEVAKYTRRIDEFYRILVRQIEKMAEIGMPNEEASSALAERLQDRVETLSGRIDLALERISRLKKRRKELPDDADAPKLLAASVKSLETNTASMTAALDLMDELELDTGPMRAELMTATQDFSSGLTDTGAAVTLAGRTLKNFMGWLVDNGPKFLLKLIFFIVIILAFRFITRFVRAGLNKAMEASRLSLSQLAKRMIVNTVANLVMIFGIMLALSQLGISLGPLLAGLGIAGFIIGFALQETLGNFASGMMILLYRPYDVGDMVDVGGVYGKVDRMSLVSTSLLTVDHQLIVIPNNKIWGDVIKNVTAQDIRRVDMVFGISYSDDIPKAESVFMDILQSHERILDHPEPMVRLHTLGESSVDFVVRPWVKVDDYWDVYWDVTRAVKLRFDEAEISIPFPQRDVHIYHTDRPAGETEASPALRQAEKEAV